MKDNIIGIISVAIILIILALYLVEFLHSRYGKVKTVKATVIHKQTVETFSQYSGNGMHTKYCVTFQMGDKRRSFYVSEFSYRGYKIGESGMLKHKGSRIIDFS